MAAKSSLATVEENFAPFVYLTIAREIESWKSESWPNAQAHIEMLSSTSQPQVCAAYVLLEASISQGLLTSADAPKLILQLATAQYSSYTISLISKLACREIQSPSEKNETMNGSCFISVLKTLPDMWPSIVNEIDCLFRSIDARFSDALTVFLAPFLNWLMMDCGKVPSECPCKVFSTVVNHLRPSVQTPSFSSESLQLICAALQECLQMAQHTHLHGLVLMSKEYLCLTLSVPAHLNPAGWRRRALDLWMAFLCAQLDAGLLVGVSIQHVLPELCSPEIISILEVRHFMCVSWMLYKSLIIPESVHLLLTIGASWSKSKRIASLHNHLLYLPLLHIVSFPQSQALLLGKLFSDNLHLARELLATLDAEPCDSQQDICSELQEPCVTGEMYESICTASSLLHHFAVCADMQVAWLDSLCQVCPSPSVDILTLLLSSRLVQTIEGPNVSKACEAVSSMAENFPAVAESFVPALIHCIHKDTSSDGRWAAFQCLAKLAVQQKSCVKQVVPFLKSLASDVRLLPAMVRLLCTVWSAHDDPVYCHLTSLLSAPLPQGISGTLAEEICIAKAATIVDMCERRAEVHGEDLLGFIVANFESSALSQPLTPNGAALVWNLSLDALKILCSREVVKPLAVWTSLISSLTDDSRSLVKSGICSYLEVFTLPQWKRDCDALPAKAFELLWTSALSKEPGVSAAAWSTLTAFPVLKICHLPHELHALLSLSGESEDVEGCHVVSLLDHVPEGACAEYFNMVKKYLTAECESLPRGLVSSAMDQARKSHPSQTAEKYLKALRDRLLPDISQDFQLVLHESFDASLQRVQIKKFVQKCKRSLAIFLEKDLPADKCGLLGLQPFNIMRRPLAWQVFIDSMIQGHVLLAKLSHKMDLTEEELVQTKITVHQELLDFIVERHRVQPLNAESVLHALVSLASCPSLLEGAGQIDRAGSRINSSPTLKDIFTLLLGLLQPSMVAENAQSSYRTIYPIFVKSQLNPIVVVCTVSSLVTRLIKGDETLELVLGMEAEVAVVVDAIVQNLENKWITNSRDVLMCGLLLNSLFVSCSGLLPKVVQVFENHKQSLACTCPHLMYALVPTLVFSSVPLDELVVLFHDLEVLWQTNRLSKDNMVWCTAYAEALIVLCKHRLLPLLHLQNFVSSLSTVPLSEQNCGVYLIFGHIMQSCSALGFTIDAFPLSMIANLWLAGLEDPSTFVCCSMALLGSLGVSLTVEFTPWDLTNLSTTANASETIRTLVQLCLPQSESEAHDAHMSLLYVLASTLTDLKFHCNHSIAPPNLSYLNEDSGLQLVFDAFREESRKDTPGWKVEGMLSLFADLGTSLPPVNWCSELLIIMCKGGPALQESCMRCALSGGLKGTEPLIAHYLTNYNLAAYSESMVLTLSQMLEFCPCRLFPCRLLSHMLEMFKIASVVTRINILESLLSKFQEQKGRAMHWMCNIHESIAMALLRVVRTDGTLQTRLLKQVVLYVLAVKSSNIVDAVQAGSSLNSLLDVVLLCESLTVLAESTAKDWSLVKRTIACTLDMKFESEKESFIAMLHLTVSCRKVWTAVEDTKVVVDILYSFNATLNQEQLTVFSRIVPLCAAHPNALSSLFVFERVLADPLMTEALSGIHPSQFTLQSVLSGHFDQGEIVLNYCLALYQQRDYLRANILSILSKLTNSLKNYSSVTTRRMLSQLFME